MESLSGTERLFLLERFWLNICLIDFETGFFTYVHIRMFDVTEPSDTDQRWVSASHSRDYWKSGR